LITSFLGEDLTAGNPSMLHHNGFQDALHKFVAKEDGAAIEDFVQKVMTDTRKYLVSYKEREKTTKDDDLQSVVFEYVAKKKSIVKTEDTQGTQAVRKLYRYAFDSYPSLILMIPEILKETCPFGNVYPSQEILHTSCSKYRSPTNKETTSSKNIDE
jgi:hypothetical protein